MPDVNHNQYQPSAATPEIAFSERRGHETMMQPFSVDSYADGLMDELFEDVEGVLDRGISLPLEPLRSQPRPAITVPFVNEPPFSLTSAIAHRQAQWQGGNPTDSLMQQAPGQLTELEPQPRRTFDRLIVIATCASAVTAVAVWGLTQGWGNRLGAALRSPAVPVTPVAIAPAPVNAEGQFSSYMQRSLETIDRVATQPNPAPVNVKLPSVSVPAVPTALNTFVQPPLVPLPAAPIAPLNNDPIRNELPQLLARLNDVLGRLNLAITRPAPPAPTSPQIKVLPLQSPNAAVAVPPALQRTLTGVLQLANPDQSAALFELNGVTQRYYPGESIGTSGWILIEVKNNQAVIRRNGDVRTLEAGQKLE